MIQSPPKLPRWPEFTLLAALVLLFFLAVFGPNTLDPRQIAWLLEGDPAQHYLGWAFFRHETWAMPPGRIIGFGLPAGASVALTDSIPLLALPFKLLDPLLPEPFQYFGLWMLACFILNGSFALRLLARLTTARHLRLLAALLLALSPPLLFRAHGHESLMAHWLILAAFELYLLGWHARRWLLLTACAALIHPYLLLMVLALLAAALLASWRDSHRTPARRRLLLLQGSGIAALLALLLWAGGYLLGGSVSGGGYQYFSMNILAFFDPIFAASRFFMQHNYSPDFAPFGQYEGFMYLGAGLIALLPLVLGLCLSPPAAAGLRAGLAALPRSFRPSASAAPFSFWPLLAAAVLLWLLALSTKVMFGSWHLFTLPLPTPLEQGLAIFRASGRFGWPLFYLLVLGLLAIVLLALPRRAAGLVLLAVLGLQLLDQSPKYQELHRLYQQRQAWHSPLAAPQWQEWAASADQLWLLLPDGPALETVYIPFAALAARHRLATNAAHLARSTPEHNVREARDYIAALAADGPPARTLHVFASPEAVPSALRAHTRQLDGYTVLPPLSVPATSPRP